MKMTQTQLRCDDNQEAVVFTKYIYSDNDISYEITIEDSYIGGGEYAGLFGRFKRAWKAFIGKPVVYTGIYTEDKKKMSNFLIDCLDIMYCKTEK